MRPKRQHFIPVLHLKRFTGHQPTGHVWTYDAATGENHSATPENTGVQSHIYSVERDDGSMDTRIEEHLATLENAAAQGYEALLDSEIPPPSQTRADFAVFLALMYVRTPSMLRNSAEMYGRYIQIMNYAYGCDDKAFEGLMRRIEGDLGRTLDGEARKRLRDGLIDPSGYTMEVPRERGFGIFEAGDNLAPMLFNMKWTLAIAGHGYFITSDNPLVRVVEPRPYYRLYGDHGFRNKTAEVSFPLSPKMLLTMSWNRDAPAHRVLSGEAVLGANRIRAAYSDRYLYAHLSDKRVERLAAEFKDSRQGWTTLGFGSERFADITVPRRSAKGGKQIATSVPSESSGSGPAQKPDSS